MNLGVSFSSEELAPGRMVEIARMAEDSGFDSVSVSDYYHPWVSAQGQFSPAQLAEQVPFGPDPEPIIKTAREAIEAGVDHLCRHQVGSNQEGFIDLWKSNLRDVLA